MNESTPRLFDWRSHHDPRSRLFGIRAAIGDHVARKYVSWQPHKIRLDQQAEGSCVGFGWTAEMMARPAVVGGKSGIIAGIDPNEFARALYHRAQVLDDWPGEDYEGSSVIAGAKAVQEGGYISGYRWAFGIDDVIDALITSGPVVIGIPWFDSMYETRPSGLVEVDGSLVGGHCITLTAYHPGIRLFREGWTNRFEVVKWRNSWGRGYGRAGDGYVKVEDLAELLDSQFSAEACVPTGRVAAL